MVRESTVTLHLHCLQSLSVGVAPCPFSADHNTLKRWRPTKSSKCWKAMDLVSEDWASSSFKVLIILGRGQGTFTGTTDGQGTLLHPQKSQAHTGPRPGAAVL